jgi:hypothetical protein
MVRRPYDSVMNLWSDVVVPVSVAVLAVTFNQWADSRKLRAAEKAQRDAVSDEQRRWRRGQITSVYLDLLSNAASPVQALGVHPLRHAPALANVLDERPSPARADVLKTLQNVRAHLMNPATQAQLYAFASWRVQSLAAELEAATWRTGFLLLNRSDANRDRDTLDSMEWFHLDKAQDVSTQLINRVRVEFDPDGQRDEVPHPRLDSNQRHLVPEG